MWEGQRSAGDGMVMFRGAAGAIAVPAARIQLVTVLGPRGSSAEEQPGQPGSESAIEECGEVRDPLACRPILERRYHGRLRPVLVGRPFHEHHPGRTGPRLHRCSSGGLKSPAMETRSHPEGLELLRVEAP